MARGVIEREQVAEAMAAIEAGGRKPTLDAINQWLKAEHGQGCSFNTLTRYKKEIEAEGRAPAGPIREPVPESIADHLTLLGGDVWREALELANTRLASEREALERVRADLEAQQQELGELADSLSADLEATRAALDSVEAERDELKGEYGLQVVQLAEKTQQLASAQQRGDELAERVADLKEQLASAQQGHAAELEQVRHEHAEALAAARADLAAAQTGERGAREQLATEHDQLTREQAKNEHITGQLAELKALLASVQQAHVAELEQARNAAAVAAEAAQASGELAAQRGGQVEELRAQLGRMEDLLSKLAKQPAARKKTPGKDGVVNSED
ncbi:DNA-binding protein [Chromobacterium phragmitis]|uniref:DNA-binding protein n=1 Tax=Chromobacterium amazonense TaxID=1382803 RepID=UPI0021B82E34|nr:DNA-binding protein [Chromobacterium amazonense]MBM2886757.1 DNA-binding protein [Chromobacterium amazonense]